MNDTNPGLGAYNPVGIPVVVVGGNTNATNFDLAGGPIIKGLFDYDLYLNTNKNVWVLASTPGADGRRVAESDDGGDGRLAPVGWRVAGPFG